MNYVSVLPRSIEEQIAKKMADGFTGSVELHISGGDIKSVKVVETFKVGG